MRGPLPAVVWCWEREGVCVVVGLWLFLPSLVKESRRKQLVYLFWPSLLCLSRCHPSPVPHSLTACSAPISVSVLREGENISAISQGKRTGHNNLILGTVDFLLWFRLLGLCFTCRFRHVFSKLCDRVIFVCVLWTSMCMCCCWPLTLLAVSLLLWYPFASLLLFFSPPFLLPFSTAVFQHCTVHKQTPSRPIAGQSKCLVVRTDESPVLLSSSTLIWTCTPRM